MYVTHRDIPNNKWNVYLRVNGQEEFIQAFDTSEEAKDFCDVNNGVLQAVN